ncbi:transposable element Tcb1 transposase [Trichonephila clavipes]|nr:transposable element Tcb1 transposase [Trichonephila clavipes]
MSLRHFRRHYEQLSQFERRRIIVMMEDGWSARRAARQLGHSDCVVTRYWGQWIPEVSFTRRPGSGCPRQTSRSDDNRVRVWRPRGERLNPVFALQLHTPLTAGVMVWGVIVYNTRAPLVLIRGTMTSKGEGHPATTCVATDATAPRSNFSTRQCLASHGKGVTRLSPHCYYPSLAFPIPRFVSIRAYLESFGSWASHETSYRTCMHQCPIVSNSAYALEGFNRVLNPPFFSLFL